MVTISTSGKITPITGMAQHGPPDPVHMRLAQAPGTVDGNQCGFCAEVDDGGSF